MVNKTTENLHSDVSAFAFRFARTLTRCMKAEGLDDKSLAAEIGINHRTIGSHRRGDTKPEFDDLHRYQLFFGLDLIRPLYAPLGYSVSEEEEGDFVKIRVIDNILQIKAR